MKLLVFDVGGTEIKYCFMDESLNREFYGQVDTPTDTKEHFFKTLKKIYDKFSIEVEGVAISMPGFIDSKKGKCNGGGWLKYNQGQSIGPELSEYLGAKVHLANDGKSAALAELENGALKGCKNAAVYIIGTGVGGGIIINNEIINGKHFTAGEYSFLKTNYDEWNNVSNMMGLKCSYRELIEMYKARAQISKEVNINGIEFFERLNNGDEKAMLALDAYTDIVAKSIMNINYLLDLEKVAIGGGISRQPILIEKIKESIDRLNLEEEKLLNYSAPKPKIVSCYYSSEANLVGAYLYYKKDMK